MPFSIVILIYGPPIAIVLAMAYMIGCESERRRSRDLHYSDEELNRAVKKSYRLGLRRGFDRGVVSRRQPIAVRRFSHTSAEAA